MKRQLLITLITAAVEFLLRVTVLKKRAAKLLLVLILACSLPAQAGQFLPFSGALTGGTTGALDAIYAGGYTSGGRTYYNALTTGDTAVHSSGGGTSFYRFVIASAPQSESVPTVIVPDYQAQGVPYTGNGAWILTALREYGSITEGPITLRDLTTPASPSSGYHKLYVKANGKAYVLDSSGVETEIGTYTLTGTALDAIFPLTGIMKHIGSGSYGIALQGTDYYAPGGIDVALADGGTGASQSDPNANCLWGWDDTDNAIKFITIGANLSYDHSTHTLSATGGGEASSTFDSIITGTNTTATLTLGTGGTLTYSGSGIVNASQYQGVTSVSGTEFGYLDGVTSAIQPQLNAKAATSHTHAGADITTGTVPIGVLPTGTSASTVALGNHTHSALYAALSHYHSGSDITSGTVGPSYLPLNSYSQAGIVTSGSGYPSMVWKTDASGNPGWRADATGSGGSVTFDGIGTGTNTSATMTVGTGGTITYSGSGIINASRLMGVTSVDATEFGYLNGVSSPIQTQMDAKAASTHTHVGTDIVSSGFSVDADGDTVVKSLTITKVSGTAGDMGLYEANSTDTDAAGFKGPTSLTANTSYRGQFPTARPTSDNMVMAWGGTAGSGDGTPLSPYIHAMSFVDLDNYVTSGGALGTPSGGTLTNCTGLPISTGLSGAGTGVLTALGNAVNGSGGITTPDGTATLTNKTIDANGTGNVIKGYGYITLRRPNNRGSATTAATTTETDINYGMPTFADDVETDNYIDYFCEVPRDIDTSVDLVAWFKFRLGAADTGDHDYIISMVSIADSAAQAGTPANAINLSYTADGSGASGDVETAGGDTLTGWKSNVTAGRLWMIRVTRDGDDSTNDASTVDSYPVELTIRYGFTQ